MAQTKNILTIFLMILMIGTLPQISTDLYTPSIPAIAQSFAVPVNWVQMSLSLFVVTQAITQLFYGPLSDGIGRRKTLLIGFFIAIIGSGVCLFASNIEMLLLGRLIQGLGAGACSALFRSIFRDSFTGEQLSKLAAYLSNIVILSVVAAPFFGGLIQQYAGWRVVFICLTVYTITTFVVTFFCFKETSVHHHKDRLKLSFIAKTYFDLFCNRQFMGYTLCVFLSYGGLFAWITSGPVVLIKLVGISPSEFGMLTIFGGLAMFVANTINGKLVTKLGMPAMMRIGFLFMFLGGASMLLLAFAFPMHVITVLLPAVIFLFGVTFIFPNTFASAFAPLGHVAGYAGAVYGFVQTIGGAVFGLLLSHIVEHTQIPLAMMLITSSVLAFCSLTFLVKPNLNKI